MTRRVGLIGGECTGKSALADALARALPGLVVPEVLREFVQTHQRPPLSGEQAGIMQAQAEREAHLMSTCALPWVVGDPAPFMTAVYSLVYFDDGALVPEAVDHLRGYDTVLWCGDDIAWQPDDGQRDGPEYREREQAVIGQLVREHLAPAGIVVHPVSGSIDDRLAQAVSACRASGDPDVPLG